MLNKIIQWVAVALLERFLDWVKDYIKMREAEKKIKKDAKDRIDVVKQIKDRKERAKRLNDIINN